MRCIHGQSGNSAKTEALTLWDADFLGQRNGGAVVILIDDDHR